MLWETIIHKTNVHGNYYNIFGIILTMNHKSEKKNDMEEYLLV